MPALRENPRAIMRALNRTFSPSFLDFSLKAYPQNISIVWDP
jgi:hypothetical protein